jgi:radical SAM protein with 4Fe4S-binding SPASM domain
MSQINLKQTLGDAKIVQKTIGDKINDEFINKIIHDHIEIIEKLVEDNLQDQFYKEILDYLKKTKKVKIKINKHVELFILNNKNNFNRIFKYIRHRLIFEKCGKEKIDIGYPPYLLIEPVSTCNLKCPFCFQIDKSFTKKPFMGVMNFDLFKKIINEASELGVGAITIASRGEPTLHPKFSEMLDYISNFPSIFECKVNTNGSFLDEKKIHSILKNNITQLVISADHYEKEKFEKLRVNSNFEKIVSNVDLLFNIRKDFYPNSITEIRVSGIDNEKNLDQDTFRDFWIQRSDHVTSSYPLERWDTYNNSVHKNINDPCENLWDRMYIWFDGKVNPCDADYKSNLSYGNFNDNKISEIWKNKKIQQLRHDHINEKRICHNPCDRCGTTFI